MASSDCPSDIIMGETQLPNNSTQTPEIISLTTIIDDCKEHIFEYLHWSDLLNVADTSKRLKTAVCNVFERRYKNARVDIERPSEDWYFNFTIFHFQVVIYIKHIFLFILITTISVSPTQKYCFVQTSFLWFVKHQYSCDFFETLDI